MNADTILIFALGLLVGYIFAVYHGKSKRAVEYLYALPVEEETQPVAVEIEKSKSGRRNRRLPAKEGYKTEREHNKALAQAERTHQTELASAVELARDAALEQAAVGVYDAYRLGAELAKHDVTFKPDEFGVRIFKALSNTEGLEVIVMPTGLHYVRGGETQLARLLNNGETRQRTIQGQQGSLPQGRTPAPYSSRRSDNSEDVPPPYSDEELASMGR